MGDGSITIKTLLEDKDLIDGLKALVKQGNDAGKSVENAFQKIGEKLQNVGEDITDLTQPIKHIAELALENGMAFQKAISGIKAVTGATAEEMELLRVAALRAGEDTKYSAVESANAIEELAKAGLTTAQILNGGLNGALVLAAAGEIGLANAAEIAATVLNAFRDDALGVEQAANILAGAANASATDVEGLSQGLKNVSAVAAGMGMSFEDVTTALAVFAQNGLSNGADAGTSFKTMLMNLIPVTDQQKSIFRELNLVTEDGRSKFYDLTGEIRPLNEIAGLLQESLADLAADERSVALEMMFGSDAIRAANILFKEGADGIIEMNDAMNQFTAADVAADRMDNLAGQVEEVEGKLETFQIRLFDTQSGALSDFTECVADLVDWLLSLDDKTLQFITTVAGIAIVAGPVISTVGKVTSAIGNAVSALSTASTAAIAFQTAIGPVGWAVEGVVAAVGIGVIAWNSHKEALENQRQTVLHLGDELVDLGAKAEAAVKSQASVEELAARYNALKDAIGGNTASESELAEAEAEISAIREQLIALSNGKISAYEAEAASTEDLLSKVQELAGVEKDRAISNLQVSLSEKNIKALEDEKAQLEKNREAYTEELQTKGEYARRINEIAVNVQNLNDSYYEGAISQEEYNAQSQTLIESVEKLNEDFGTAFIGLGDAALAAGDATKAYDELNEKIEKADADLAAAGESIGEYYNKQEALAVLTGEITEEIGEETEAIDEQTEAMESNTEATASNTENIKEGEHAYRDITEAIKETKEAAEEAAKAEKEAAKAAAEATEDYCKRAGSAYDDYYNKVTNTLSKIEVAEQTDKDNKKKTYKEIRDEMTETAEHNITTLREFEENLEKLEEKGLNLKFIEDLRNAGAEQSELVAAWVDGDKEEIARLNDVFAIGASDALNSMKRVLELPENAVLGEEFIAQVAAYTENSDALVLAAEKQIVRAREAMEAALNASDPLLREIGGNLTQGLVVGVQSGIPQLRQVAGELFAEWKASFMKAANMHSPSKETAKLGEFLAEGVSIGVNDGAEEVKQAGADLAEGAMSGIADGIQKGAVIALGEWTEYGQNMKELAQKTGAAVLQTDIETLEARIKEHEKANKEMTNSQKLADAEAAITKAETDGKKLIQEKETALAEIKIDQERLMERKAIDLEEMKLDEEKSLRKKKQAVDDAKNATARRAANEEYVDALRKSAEKVKRADEDFLEEKEKSNDRIAKAEKDLADAIDKTKSDSVKAQDNYNKLIADNELAAQKEQLKNTQEHLKEIQNAYTDMSKALTSALKEQYSQQKDAAKEALQAEYEIQKETLDKTKEARKDALDAQVDAVKEATKTIIEQYEQEYNARLKTLDSDESAEIRALQDQIDEMNALTDAEEQALKARQNQQKLSDLQQKIIQAATDEARLAAQKAYDEEAAKQQRDALLAQRKAEQASLKEQINQIKASYKEQKEAAKQDLSDKKDAAKAEQELQLENLKVQKQAVDDDYKEQKVALDAHLKEQQAAIDANYKALTDKQRLESEAAKMMVDGDQKAIVDLLNKYTPDWAAAGQSSGEAFLNALRGVTPSIEGEVSKIMSSVNQVRQAEENLKNEQERLKVEAMLKLEWDTAMKNAGIPVLHSGGISMKEQPALINGGEAVIPLDAMWDNLESNFNALQSALRYDLATAQWANSTTISPQTITNNNDRGVTINVDYYSSPGGNATNDGYDLGQSIAFEMRSRGLTAM